jgi:hypothetical protein
MALNTVFHQQWSRMRNHINQCPLALEHIVNFRPEIQGAKPFDGNVVWVGDGATGVPDPKTLSGMGLDPSPLKTDGQYIYGTGMGLAPSPTRVAGTIGARFRPTNVGGDGASPIPSPYWPSVLDGDGFRPGSIPDKVLGSGTPAAASPTHTDPFLNPRHFLARSLPNRHPIGSRKIFRDSRTSSHMWADAGPKF